ncbi:hypothetical protein [Pedobacter endophyticus]|uniref:Uncharacterized protein n=1 Tax=Pedobacter endophyticus TaxID=2789740 RepID=A0A7S9L2C7_9SPHI|nr:hypothetical protein [Pedobacter endophyticus]QPH41205.1 hypothetical protein IZT61_08110 [Pedobacter endophyticus]
MQPIRDKDFDQLFKNAFDDAEISPSKDLWSGIEQGIEPKKKKTILMYWLSAAAVLLVAAVSFLIYQQGASTDNNKKLASNKIEKASPIAQQQPLKDSAATVATPIEDVQIPLVVKAQTAVEVAKVKVKPVTKPENKKVITAPEMLKQETVIAKVDETPKDIKTKIKEAILEQTEEPVLASNANAIKVDEVIGEGNETENKGIRNVGDVVNLIVNTVDKRKDKFIQFRTDDDDSSLSSINIGPFKFGKKKK